MKNFEDRLAAFHGAAFMARDEFRGKSKGQYRRPQAYMHKQYADTFAVYKK